MLKKNMQRIKNEKKAIKMNIIVSVVLIVFLSFMTVGYAVFGENLLINGIARVKPQGKFAITGITLIEESNVRSDSIPAYSDESINLNLVFEKAEGSTTDVFMAKYLITIENNTFFSYDIDFSGYSPIIRDSKGHIIDASTLSYTVEGLDPGESIPAGENKNVYITIIFTPEDVEETYDVEGDIEPEVVEKPNGTILASITSGTNGDLTQGHSLTPVTLSLLSSYRTDKTAFVNISNPNFVITDSSGNPLDSIVIAAENTTEQTIYIKLKDDAKFAVDSVTTSVTMTYNDIYFVDCGSVTIAVDIDESFIDTTPPIISNVVAEIQDATSSDTSNNSVGSIKVTWNVDDEAVDHYTVMIYSVNGATETLLNTYDTSQKQYTFTGLTDGDYVFKVYGTDSSDRHNTATQNDINNANTSAGYCCKSASGSFDWHYTVTTNLTYCTESNTNKKVNRGFDFTTTVTKNADQQQTCGTTTYSLPNSITVKMGGNNISSGTSRGQYRYTGSSTVSPGDITVYGVTGDLEITVTGTSS